MYKVLVIAVILISIALVSPTLTFAWGMMGEWGDFGQDTLLDSGKTTLGFLAGPVFEGTWVNNQTVFAGGFEMAAIINHSFYLGFIGKGSVVPGYISTNGRSASIGWGELMLGYSLFPNLIVHPVARIMAGAGSIMEMNYNNRNMMYNYNMNRYFPFFAAETELGVEFNLLKWVKIEPYAGYRYAQGNINWNGIYDYSLQNFSFGVNLDFGIF